MTNIDSRLTIYTFICSISWSMFGFSSSYARGVPYMFGNGKCTNIYHDEPFPSYPTCEQGNHERCKWYVNNASTTKWPGIGGYYHRSFLPRPSP